MHTILFAGGGSIGHIAPSVAVWHAVQQMHSDVSAHFVCSDRGQDEVFLKAEGCTHTVLHAPRMGIALLWQFPVSVWRALAILRQHTPAVVFSKGGYVAVPVCVAAWLLKIPIVQHETDSILGRANRWTAALASKVCLGFPSNDPSGKYIHTGNPVRVAISNGSRQEGQQITGFSGERPVLLVTGGSQGAQNINNAIAEQIDALTQTWDIIHLTGVGKGIAVESPHYYSEEFATATLPHLFALADCAISRGGGSIAELSANGIAVIAVPLRGVGHDHQQRNAELLAKRNAAIVLQDEELAQQLLPALASLHSKQAEYKEHLRGVFTQNADSQIAQILCGYLAS